MNEKLIKHTIITQIKDRITKNIIIKICPMKITQNN